jgi:hypothetical protein
MKQFLDSCRRASTAIKRASLAALRAVRAWLSVPVNACIAALAAAFLVSALSWALGDRYAEVALFFPSGRGASLGGEMRDLPRPRGPEARAELVASELLLGPRDPALHAAFPQGTRLVSAIYRKGRLFVDLSDDAALAEPAVLRAGLAAIERSLRLALPGLKRLTVTIGGREPYADSETEGNGAKKQKNN